MTKNQIEYAKLLESRRSNLANEDLTKARDKNAYEINLRNAAESERHNRATEAQARASLDETIRANQAREAHEVNVLAETSRSNRAREEETKRSNLAKEAETNRSNLAREKETYRSNVARETETARSNRANESLNSRNIDISQMSLAERVRAAQAQEAHNRAVLSETQRHNQASEDVGRLNAYAKGGIIGQAVLGRDAANYYLTNQRITNTKQGGSSSSRYVGANAKVTTSRSSSGAVPKVTSRTGTTIRKGGGGSATNKSSGIGRTSVAKATSSSRSTGGAKNTYVSLY